MIPERRHRPMEDNVDSWLMSYADMITLLLCFFIIFVSVSEPKKDKLTAITQGIHDQFGSVDLSTPFQGVFRALEIVVETHRMLKDVAIEMTESSVTMELSTLAFFQKDSVEINPDMLPVLTELAAALKKINFIDYHITVEGHTSDVAPTTPLYPTNWELSTARAARVVRFLISCGIKPDRLRAVGYADTEPKVPNLDANGHAIVENRNKNQRIVIKLERIL
ncbi:MAG: flagellar motor protein MotB [Pseudomonadota bacterium]|nr:flagellar motor protein MotB [Pseudomonadota bacterium]MDE3036832.1 flagellar motor protein MotB [Pseudomonadota bacterium]